MYPTLLFSLKVSDMLRSFHSPLNLCAPLTGESQGGVSSYFALIVSNHGAGRNGGTSECSRLHIVSSRASGTPSAGSDQMMLPREDALSSSESFIYQRMSIFEKMEKKSQGTYIFYF